MHKIGAERGAQKHREVRSAIVARGNALVKARSRWHGLLRSTTDGAAFTFSKLPTLGYPEQSGDARIEDWAKPLRQLAA